MGKTKPSKKSSSKSKKAARKEKSLLNTTGGLSSNSLSTSTTAASPSSSDPDVNDIPTLLSAAHELLYTASQPAEALALTTHLLTLAPSSLPVLELHALSALDLGDEATARSTFARAATLDADGAHETDGGSGPEKFLWLAQLSETGGAETVGWYTRAAEVLRRWLADAREGRGKEDFAARGLENKLVSALCGLTEVYMSDLCMEPDAEQRCEAYMTEAALVSPENPEALVTLGSVRLSQSRPEDAAAALQRSFAEWREREPNDPEIPSYATRIKLAQLLIETAQYETALEVLERLTDEDDQLPDLWYLGGLSNHLLGEQLKPEQLKTEQLETPKTDKGKNTAEENTRESDPERWTELWQEARVWLRNCLALYEALQWEDEGIREHAEELLRGIEAAGVPEREEGAEGADEDEWESDDDDDGDGDGDEEMKDL